MTISTTTVTTTATTTDNTNYKAESISLPSKGTHTS